MFNSCQIKETEISRDCLFIPHLLTGSHVMHSGRKFTVIDSQGEHHRVGVECLSSELRNIETAQLGSLLAAAYLVLNKTEETYTLQLRGRLQGAGPFSAAIGYWVTKALCYGTAAAAVTTAVVATGGMAAGAGGAMIAGGAMATVATSTGTAVVASAIASSAAATAIATEVTVAAVASAGTLGAAIAGIETAAATVGLALLACPFLP